MPKRYYTFANTQVFSGIQQQGFQCSILLATKSRRYHWQQASVQPGSVGDDSDMKRVILHHIFTTWQESWSQQLDNKLHSVKLAIETWPVKPMRRVDIKLTRLRIGHTRFTHMHLSLGKMLQNVLHARFRTPFDTF
ncbi:RNase H domain-containing protein [Trichonephila clavipes]|nr:RNase H domain-containing protein [Trichonephila clavipes]